MSRFDLEHNKTPLMKRLRPRLAAAPYDRRGGFLLSVSGGLDSMVLLDVFIRMAHIHRRPIRVFHAHHHTGAFADHSRDVVESYCRDKGLPLAEAHFHWDGSGNFEYKAAAFRRNALAGERAEGEWIVLAHHLQDQAETFLQTLVRGAGGATHLGMSPERGHRLRPLLDIDRSLLARHAAQMGVPHVVDPTNYDQRNFRNAIRQRVMPLLRGFHGKWEARLAGWLGDYRELCGELDAEASGYFQEHFRDGLLGRAAFRQSKPYLWDFILKHFWESQGMPKPKRAEHQRLREWLAHERCGSWDHAGRRIYCDLDGLKFESPPPTEAHGGVFGQECVWGRWRFRLDLLSRPEHEMLPLRDAGFLLVPGTHTPDPIGDYLRRQRVPHRIRAMLPAFIIGNNQLHLCQILSLRDAGRMDVEHLGGPNPLHFLRGGEFPGELHRFL